MGAGSLKKRMFYQVIEVQVQQQSVAGLKVLTMVIQKSLNY